MKSILLSIKPEWLAKILNGEKTIEVRKKFPKDYTGWVYLYCSKDSKKTLSYKAIQLEEYKKDAFGHKYRVAKAYTGFNDKEFKFQFIVVEDIDVKNGWGFYTQGEHNLNGKVVARFWCDKVDKWDIWQKDLEEKIKLACLSIKEFDDYSKGQVAYAIHISNLEVFDKPKELSEFHTVNKLGIPQYQFGKGTCEYRTVKKAPQNYCYIEGEE